MTTKPYEELYQFHVQPFVHATQMESLAAYAASKGFRGFKSMYKKYVESLKAQSGTLYIENVTQFTNQPLELNAGEWEADDLGIHKKNGFNDEIACPHPIKVVDIKYDNSGRHYTVELQTASQYLGDVTQYQEQIAELESAAAEKDSTITAQASTIQSQESQIESQTATIQEQATTIQELREAGTAAELETGLDAAYEEGVNSVE